MRASGANQAVWRTGGSRMGVSGANLAVWRTGGGWMGVSGANQAVWRTGWRLFERYGLHYMLLGVWQAKNVSAEK